MCCGLCATGQNTCPLRTLLCGRVPSPWGALVDHSSRCPILKLVVPFVVNPARRTVAPSRGYVFFCYFFMSVRKCIYQAHVMASKVFTKLSLFVSSGFRRNLVKLARGCSRSKWRLLPVARAWYIAHPELWLDPRFLRRCIYVSSCA